VLPEQDQLAATVQACGQTRAGPRCFHVPNEKDAQVQNPDKEQDITVVWENCKGG